MRFVWGVAVVLSFAACAAVPARAAGDVPRPSADDQTLYFARDALKAADARKWDRAAVLAAEAPEPLVGKLVTWLKLTDRDTLPGFAELARFIAASPDWPEQAALREKAERALVREGASDADCLAWFAGHPPSSRDGRIRMAEALEGVGREAEADDLIRRIWIEEDFGASEAKAFYRSHKKTLRTEDHAARLDRLLWDGRSAAARRMFPLVDAGHAKLAEARLRLMDRSGGVDSAIAAVPAELKDDPGLAFDRLSWRRKKGRDDEARDILADAPADLVRPDLWWRERAIQVRAALDEGYVSEAYELAADNRLPAGPERADAEWLAGWIALSFLGEPEDAFQHFAEMRALVNYPISVARASYWAGRAMAAMGNEEAARNWYRDAAQHWHTYYGQLAAVTLHAQGIEAWPLAVPALDTQGAALKNSELARAAELLAGIGAGDHLEPFLLRLAQLSRSPADAAYAARLALLAGQPQLSVKVAKEATKQGYAIVPYAYPLVSLPLSSQAGDPEEALLLAVVRQESAFDPKATSGAGARGLMQLMPATARQVARVLKVSESTERLTADPAYNLLLGSTYLSSLVNAYEGSYVLALAAYNAGPSNVRRWVRQYGDPRDAEVDIVDWVELVPFEETRNYIQRVLEGLQVYRLLLGGADPEPMLVHDLKRSTRTPQAAKG